MQLKFIANIRRATLQDRQVANTLTNSSIQEMNH